MFLTESILWAYYRIGYAVCYPVISLFDALFDLWVEEAEKAAEEYMAEHKI